MELRYSAELNSHTGLLRLVESMAGMGWKGKMGVAESVFCL
jgi:hypothetical protein